MNKNADIKVIFFCSSVSFIHCTPVCVVQCTSGVPFLHFSDKQGFNSGKTDPLTANTFSIWRCASVFPGTEQERPIDTENKTTHENI